MNADYAIESDGLTRRFGNLVAVDGVTLRIPRGRIYGFLGPNGSGKSTTIRMLCGLLKATEGEVRVLDLSIPKDAERLRQRIGYMTQKFSFYEDLTVAENLEFIADIFGIPVQSKKTAIAENLERYWLVDQTKQRAGTLSGGQKQRLALAGVTLHSPELLLLDEPTSAVDPQSRREFWESLFELADKGTTILVSTHFMDEAERCHRLAILDEGKLVAEGTPATLADTIDATVLDVATNQPRAVQAALLKVDFVRAVTQLGTRLHAMVDPHRGDAADELTAVLRGQSLDGQIKITRPTLEDVFVAATGFDHNGGHA
jgi:ABC-2 type transport system ATP-binding protein